MIDAHHHFWRYNAQEFGWITPDMAVLRADFGPDQLQRECHAAGIDGVISVQSRTSLAETDALLAHADRHDFILGVVGWIDLAAEVAPAALDRYAQHPRFVGVREICQGAPDAQFFDNSAFNRGIDQLAAHDLAYDLLIFADQLPSAIRFVDRHPEQPFVLDHCAKPPIRRGEFPKHWAAGLHDLARRDNVYCKLSGLATEIRDSDRVWDADLLRPYFESALEAFGPQRLMFGSDWPVSLLATSYQHWVAACHTLAASLSANDQAAFFAETARRFYL